MTLHRHIQNLLEGHGVWPDESKEIMERVIARETLMAMRGRWDQSFEDYPEPMVNLVWVQAKEVAVAYLKERKPGHFAIAILTGIAPDGTKLE